MTDSQELRVPTEDVDAVVVIAVEEPATWTVTPVVLEGEHILDCDLELLLTNLVNLRSKLLTDGVPLREEPNSPMSKLVKPLPPLK